MSSFSVQGSAVLAFRPFLPRFLILSLLLVLAALTVEMAPAQALELPRDDSQQHVGVAQCSSTACHGVIAERRDGNVLHNEFRTWSKHDLHSRAFKALQGDQGKAIAHALGLPDASTASECLGCHSDNVAPSARGPNFRQADGVGCEACHGGAERWLKPHAEKGATHAANVANGMFPTELPAQRAELCLSCHLGNDQQFASHRLMAAGHPRMSFELSTFTVLQPSHYLVDDDYRQRKGEIPEPRLWAIGQIASARRMDALLHSHWFAPSSPVPEPALFDCHACHHAMEDTRWQPSDISAGLPPGTIRYNDASLTMARVIAERLSPPLAKDLLEQGRQLHKASLVSREAMLAASSMLMGTLAKLEAIVQTAKFSDQDVRAMLVQVLAWSASGEFRDYTSAEQAVMAVDMMVATLGGSSKMKADIDQLYTVVKDEHRFSPKDFANRTKALTPRFRAL